MTRIARGLRLLGLLTAAYALLVVLAGSALAAVLAADIRPLVALAFAAIAVAAHAIYPRISAVIDEERAQPAVAYPTRKEPEHGH